MEVPETDATLSAASSWRVDLPVQICNDGVPEHENGETFTLQLERADANAALLPEQVPGHPDDNDGVGTIFDPDAMPRVFVDDVKALENAGSMVFLVRLSYATSGDVDVTGEDRSGFGAVTGGLLGAVARGAHYRGRVVGRV